MKTSRWTSVMLLALSLLLALSFAFVKAGPVQAEEGAGIPLVKFEGVVTGRPTGGKVGTWTVGEQDVEATETTILVETEGEAIVGAQVIVIAKKVAEEEFEAILIRVKSTEVGMVVYLAGVVEEPLTDEALKVNGKTIKITDQTQIEGDLVVGAHVLVKARFDGEKYEAIKIQVMTRDWGVGRFVEFDGLVSKIEDTQWIIAERTVKITERTVIMGSIAVGDRVKVRAYKTADGLVALLIKKAGASWWPKVEEFTGVIVSLPDNAVDAGRAYIGDWVIGEHTVVVTAFTRIVGEPEVGATAKVMAWHFTDGKWVAMEIKIVSDEPPADEITFTGTINEFPRTLWGTWKIGEREVLVLPGTRIKGMPEVGLEATVTGREKDDGVVVAHEIDIKGSEEPEPIEGIHLIGQITEVGTGYIMIRPPVPLGTIRIGITAATVVTGGPLAVGQCVAVRARDTGGHQYEAIEITVGECPGPRDGGKDIGRTVD